MTRIKSLSDAPVADESAITQIQPVLVTIASTRDVIQGDAAVEIGRASCRERVCLGV